MAKLKYLMIHCSLTREDFQLKPDHIIQWHTNPKPKGNGWSRVGYSDLILRDGSLHNLMPFDQDNEVDHNEMTWGAKGMNGITRHVCLEGGLDVHGKNKSPLTSFPAIEDSLQIYLQYTILRHPEVIVCGHYDFSSKTCPNFNVHETCLNFHINEQNIL